MSIIHSVKNPARIKNVLAFTFLTLFWTYKVIHSWNDSLWSDKGHIISLSIDLLALLLYLAILIITIFRALKKPTELLMNEHNIKVNGRTIQADEIKVVMIMGYFKPVIGIKPRGKKVVPLNLCFRYSDNEDKAIADLKGWAETNSVKMVNKSFMSWL